MTAEEQLRRLIAEYPELQPTPLEVLTRLAGRFDLAPPDESKSVEEECQRMLDFLVTRYGNVVQAQPGEIEGTALVRDAQGKPKIANIFGIPRPIWVALTRDERQEIRSRGGYSSDE